MEFRAAFNIIREKDSIAIKPTTPRAKPKIQIREERIERIEIIEFETETLCDAKRKITSETKNHPDMFHLAQQPLLKWNEIRPILDEPGWYFCDRKSVTLIQANAQSQHIWMWLAWYGEQNPK